MVGTTELYNQPSSLSKEALALFTRGNQAILGFALTEAIALFDLMMAFLILSVFQIVNERTELRTAT